MGEADVYVLPGIERRDIVGVVVPSEEVLHAAIRLGVTDIVIVGKHRDGSLYVAGETNDIDRAAGLLLRGAHHLTSGEYNGGMSSEEEAPDDSEPA